MPGDEPSPRRRSLLGHSPLGYIEGAWAEDRATRGPDPSADPQGPRPARAARCRPTAYRDWPESDKSIHSLCSQSLAWRATPFVPFPLNQHTSARTLEQLDEFPGCSVTVVLFRHALRAGLAHLL